MPRRRAFPASPVSTYTSGSSDSGDGSGVRGALLEPHQNARAAGTLVVLLMQRVLQRQVASRSQRGAAARHAFQHQLP